MSASPEPEEADRVTGAPHPREAAVLAGQEAAEAAFLAAARSGRLPHGWLIAGPRGVGKATLAWRIARFLLAGRQADDGLAMDPGEPVFRQVVALSHPGLYLCRRPWDDKVGRLRAEIPVDAVRGLRSFFRLSATEGGARVAIIDAAEEMNVSAANALLKILEEPPSGAILILVSHRPARLLPTIRSRCRILNCRPLASEALAVALDAAGVAEPGDPAVLAELAGGSVGAAVGLLAGGGLERYGELVALLAGGPPLDRPRLIAMAESAAGRTGASRLVPVLQMTELLLARLARAAAGADVRPTSPVESGLFAHLAARPDQARRWAETAARVAERSGHARAVHLDPAQVILDTFFEIDAAAGEAARPAA